MGIALPLPTSPFLLLSLSSFFLEGVNRLDFLLLFLEVVGVDEGVGRSLILDPGVSISADVVVMIPCGVWCMVLLLLLTDEMVWGGREVDIGGGGGGINTVEGALTLLKEWPSPSVESLNDSVRVMAFSSDTTELTWPPPPGAVPMPPPQPPRLLRMLLSCGERRIGWCDVVPSLGLRCTLAKRIRLSAH